MEAGSSLETSVPMRQHTSEDFTASLLGSGHRCVLTIPEKCLTLSVIFGGGDGGR